MSSEVVEALAAELKERAAIAVDYQNKINTAKTNVKRNLYKKKLKKNNEEAAKIVTALERIQLKQRVLEQAENDSKD